MFLEKQPKTAAMIRSWVLTLSLNNFFNLLCVQCAFCAESLCALRFISSQKLSLASIKLVLGVESFRPKYNKLRVDTE